ncbi:Uncharacterised protein [Candidatus Anstonella stagnisolia]|nr:Uncharacterised protein [Candidatus Anstonella stagnisolia]
MNLQLKKLAPAALALGLAISPFFRAHAQGVREIGEWIAPNDSMIIQLRQEQGAKADSFFNSLKISKIWTTSYPDKYMLHIQPFGMDGIFTYNLPDTVKAKLGATDGPKEIRHLAGEFLEATMWYFAIPGARGLLVLSDQGRGKIGAFVTGTQLLENGDTLLAEPMLCLSPKIKNDQIGGLAAALTESKIIVAVPFIGTLAAPYRDYLDNGETPVKLWVEAHRTEDISKDKLMEIVTCIVTSNGANIFTKFEFPNGKAWTFKCTKEQVEQSMTEIETSMRNELANNIFSEKDTVGRSDFDKLVYERRKDGIPQGIGKNAARDVKSWLKVPEAVKMITKAYELDPNEPSVLLSMGEIGEAYELRNEAFNFYVSAGEKGADSFMDSYEAARHLYEAGFVRESKTYALRALRISDEIYPAYLLAAEIHAALGEFDDAYLLLSKAKAKFTEKISDIDTEYNLTKRQEELFRIK